MLEAFFNSLLRYTAEYADIQTMTGIILPTCTRGHHFFNNLLELFYGVCIAEDLDQEILPSPQEDPRGAGQPLESP